VEESAEFPVMELGRPGPERDQGIAAIRSGTKTALTALLDILEHEGEPAPVPGQRFLLIDSAGNPALVIELTEVAVVPVSEVGDGFAQAEGRGYTDAAEWRAAHEELFTSPEVTAYLGFTPVIHDGTLVVTQRFRRVGDEAGSRSSGHPSD
jgi:uncharacterized protein YhfF